MPLTLSTSLVALLLAFGFAMSVWVYRANPDHEANRGFPLMVLAILLWVLFYHLAQLGNATLWFRLSTSSVFMFFVAYYFFVVRWFLGKNEPGYRVLGTAILVYGIAFGALAFATDFVITGSMRAGPVARPFLHGIGRSLFYGFVTAVTFFINWMLLREYFRYPRERRLKIQYFLIGLLLFAGLNVVFNVALPVAFDVYEFYEVGNYSVIFLLGFTAYAIVKQELFGIRTILTTLFVGAIALLLAIDTLGFTEQQTLQVFKLAVIVLFLYFGYSLVKSIHREIAQREELQKIATELERSNDAKTEFISIVSHQLRSPLNATKGYLSLLRDGTYGELAESMQRPIERLYRSNERLIRLVNDLLGVSRIQMGRIELEVGPVDMCKVADSVVDEFSMAAEERGIRLFATCPEAGVPVLRGDRQKLRDSILNLVDNAIRYTEKGSVHVSIETEEDTLVVKVTDTGEGLDSTEARALFESFQRGDVGRRHWTEGTGLGLYIAQQFVALHQGEIWAESPGKGKGSTFFIKLPLKSNKLAA